jgi:hypothetical protein
MLSTLSELMLSSLPERTIMLFRSGQLHYRLILALAALVLASLACNLVNNPDPTAIPAPTQPPAVVGDPVITVLWPPFGSEFVVREEVPIHVSAADSTGITRVELRSDTSMLSSVQSPERNGQPTMDAILSWRPTRAGQQDLQVIAYRGRVASEPTTLTIFVRSRQSEVSATPVPYGAMGAAAAADPDAVCRVRVDIGNLRFRSGPSTNTEIMGILELGETLSVTGVNSTRTWYQIRRSGQTAWVSAASSYSTELTSCASAPAVQ